MPGGHTCSACPAGYSGTGETGCTDINECDANNGGCDVLAYVINSGLSNGIRHLIAIEQPGGVLLLGITAVTSGNAIVRAFDVDGTTSATVGSITPTSLAAAGTNMGFRGIALSPVP